MAIVVKAKANDSTNDLIKRFKKIVVTTDIVQKVKDRQFYQKPSQMKKMKNIPPEVIVRMTDKLSTAAK